MWASTPRSGERVTDWIFAGDWIHRRFTYPEIWREGPETKAILWSSVLPWMTCATFIALAAWLRVHELGALLKVAFLLWRIGPLPLMLTNAAFIQTASCVRVPLFFGPADQTAGDRAVVYFLLW